MSARCDCQWRVGRAAERAQQVLARRIDKLEASLQAPAPPASLVRRALKGIGSVMPQLLSSAVMLVLGFWVKDSVDIAIRQQQLQLSFLAQMKSELVDIAKEGASPEEIERSAMMVAAFGKPAVVPLMNELRKGGNRLIGAEAGLRSLAFTDAEPVCDIVSRAIDAPTPVFVEAEGLMAAVRTLGAAGCSQALPNLRSMLERLRVELDNELRKPAAERTRLVSELNGLIETLEAAVATIRSRQRHWWQRG